MPSPLSDSNSNNNSFQIDDLRPKSQFALKLHRILDADETDDLRWLDGDTFEITGDEGRARAVLQQSFSMKSTASFIRQASYYGFDRLSDRRKKGGADASRRGIPPPIKFRHPSGNFLRGEPDLARTVSRVSKTLAAPRAPRAKKAPRAFVVPAPARPLYDESDSDPGSLDRVATLQRLRPLRTISCPAGLPTMATHPMLRHQSSPEPEYSRQQYVDWHTVLARPTGASSTRRLSRVHDLPVHQTSASESSYYSPVEGEHREWSFTAPLSAPSYPHDYPPEFVPMYSDPGFFMRNSQGYFDPIRHEARGATFDLPPLRLPSISVMSGQTLAHWQQQQHYSYYEDDNDSEHVESPMDDLSVKEENDS